MEHIDYRSLVLLCNLPALAEWRPTAAASAIPVLVPNPSPPGAVEFEDI